MNVDRVGEAAFSRFLGGLGYIYENMRFRFFDDQFIHSTSFLSHVIENNSKNVNQMAEAAFSRFLGAGPLFYSKYAGQ